MRKFAQTFFSDINMQTFFERYGQTHMRTGSVLLSSHGYLLSHSCGVADLIVTCFSGRNRKVSEAFVVTKKVRCDSPIPRLSFLPLGVNSMCGFPSLRASRRSRRTSSTDKSCRAPSQVCAGSRPTYLPAYAWPTSGAAFSSPFFLSFSFAHPRSMQLKKPTRSWRRRDSPTSTNPPLPSHGAMRRLTSLVPLSLYACRFPLFRTIYQIAFEGLAPSHITAF